MSREEDEKWTSYGGYEPKKDSEVSSDSVVMKNENRMEMNEWMSFDNHLKNLVWSTLIDRIMSI